MQVPNLWTSSLLGFTATKPPTFVTLRSHLKVSDHLQLLIFVAATRFYQCLIVDLAPIDACVVRRYNTSQISQGITHKSSKGLQNVARISLLYVDKLEWNPKRFRGLGLDLKFYRISFSAILNRSSLILDRLSLADCDFPFLQSTRTWNLKLKTYTFEHYLTHKLDMFCSWFINTYKIWF